MKKVCVVFVCAILLAISVSPAFAAAASDSEIAALKGTTLYVYNWGEYISDGTDGGMNVNQAFEDKYGIHVVYDTFDNNEVMYSKIKGGGVNYDVVIPSDYMIERMINEDMLEPIDFDNIPNFSNIDAKYKNPVYDPQGLYSVPYNVGMVGLIYNTTVVKEAPTSWKTMWDKQYSGKILMFNNPRDAFAIAQSILGIDYNTTDESDWQKAADLLCEQKSVVQSYVNDEIFDKLESGEAAIGAYYAGDYLTMHETNPDLAFVYPSEGVNYFVDAACILKGTRNKLAAELYINFLQEPDVALANAETICYASPNTAVINNSDYTYYGNEVLYPSADKTPKTEIFTNLPSGTLSLMSSLWEKVKNYDSGDALSVPESNSLLNSSTAPASDSSGLHGVYICLIIVAVLIVVFIIFRAVRKKKRDSGV